MKSSSYYAGMIIFSMLNMMELNIFDVKLSILILSLYDILIVLYLKNLNWEVQWKK